MCVCTDHVSYFADHVKTAAVKPKPLRECICICVSVYVRLHLCLWGHSVKCIEIGSHFIFSL